MSSGNESLVNSVATDGKDYVESNSYDDGELLQKILDITLRENLYKRADEQQKVVDFLHPHELKKELPLDISRKGCKDKSEIEDLIERIVKYSVRTTHPHYYNQLYGGLDEVGLMSSWLLESLNTNQHTFEVSPVFVTIERFLINKLTQLFGWNNADGIFAPGGNLSNMYGILLARHKMMPHLKDEGLFGQKELVAFTSDMGHYSIPQAAGFMGFGTDQVVEVVTDEHGRMRAKDLLAAVEKVEKEGRHPFFVNATAGTTVFGSFDPIEEIAEVCQQKKLWLHVDGCWGGSAILSRKYKSLLIGIERADSIAWNPHKMLGTPLQCSVFLVKYKDLLLECIGTGATYLFQPDKLYDVSYDLGDKSIQCGRKADALKLWLALKVHGLEKLEARIDNAFEVANYFEEEIKKRKTFRLVLEERDFTNICFWYIPPSLQDLPNTEEWWMKLHKITAIIKARLVEAGTMMIGYQPVECKNLVNFFRMVITSSPISSKEHMNFVLHEIDRIGKDL